MGGIKWWWQSALNGDEAVIKSGKDKINDNEDEFKGDGEVLNDNGVGVLKGDGQTALIGDGELKCYEEALKGNGEALKDDEGA